MKLRAPNKNDDEAQKYDENKNNPVSYNSNKMNVLAVIKKKWKLFNTEQLLEISSDNSFSNYFVCGINDENVRSRKIHFQQKTSSQQQQQKCHAMIYFSTLSNSKDITKVKRQHWQIYLESFLI